MRGRPVSACNRAMKATQREKFGRATLVLSHQCELSPYQPASWSATSWKIRSQVEPYGLLESPADPRNAASLSATVFGLTLGSVLVARSIPVPHAELWIASRMLAFVLY